ncbi:MAG: hypothetical protein ACXAD7_12405 [Candidatus Kariarchaeaceae archaeon]|jgi:DNA-binding transcriptional ArsR family regulator
MLEDVHKRRVLVKKPSFLKIIRDDKIIEVLKDQNHYPILKILKKEPMTVKELEEAYEKETGKKKSNKTIYRYLKTLEESELVISAGQLVISGKTATETIYARSAIAFFFMVEGDEDCDDCDKDLITQGIGIFLSPLFGNKTVSNEKLSKLMKDYDLFKMDELEKLSNNVEDKISDIFQKIDFKQIGSILEFSSLIAGLKADFNLLERMEDCFT